jgi:hypothetical protein
MYSIAGNKPTIHQHASCRDTTLFTAELNNLHCDPNSAYRNNILKRIPAPGAQPSWEMSNFIFSEVN